MRHDAVARCKQLMAGPSDRTYSVSIFQIEHRLVVD